VERRPGDLGPWLRRGDAAGRHPRGAALPGRRQFLRSRHQQRARVRLHHHQLPDERHGHHRRRGRGRAGRPVHGGARRAASRLPDRRLGRRPGHRPRRRAPARRVRRRTGRVRADRRFPSNAAQMFGMRGSRRAAPSAALRCRSPISATSASCSTTSSPA
jgi:hypothetical protein